MEVLEHLLGVLGWVALAERGRLADRDLPGHVDEPLTGRDDRGVRVRPRGGGDARRVAELGRVT